MAGSTPAVSGRVFISYRREETAYAAGWLFDRLVAHLGRNQVFKDVDSIQLGDDFIEVISAAVGSCDVLLALIGNEWLTITDADGRRRLDDPDDFVRVEIEAALRRRVRVIPVLTDEARMPRADELPASLATLVRRQALELSPARFEFDTSRLLSVLDGTLAEVRTEQEDAASTKTPVGKATDPSTTALSKALEEGERPERSPTPGIPQAAATPARPLPSDSGKPPEKYPRPGSTRQRVLQGAGVAVVAALIVTALITDERIARPTAERFLRGYYEQAVRAADRDHAWNMLTVGFQQNPEKHPEGRKTYDEWFDRWQTVQVEHVDSVVGEPNKFEANLTYISRTGSRSLLHKTHIQLVCSWWIRRLPFRNCRPEDIKIEDSVLKGTSEG
jgi:hypothetical protein